MKVFALYGYTPDKEYSKSSKTSILYALVKTTSSPPVTKVQKINLGSTKPSAIRFFNGSGIEKPISIYIGSTLVWEQ